MSKPPPAPPTLAELRKEIDAIDEQVHRLLMARGDIIDRLIRVKQTQEVGSAFRPAREASMMRQNWRCSLLSSAVIADFGSSTNPNARVVSTRDAPRWK